MAQLKTLTEYSFIVETDLGEKIGILVDYNEGTTERTGVEFFSSSGTLKFNSIEELEQLLGEKIKIFEKEIPDNTTSSKFLGDYPINDTDTIVDIQSDDELQIGTFRKSTRSKKRFYPGWWIIKSEAGNYSARLTISVDIYNERKNTDELNGPYKNYMELTYNLKKLQE